MSKYYVIDLQYSQTDKDTIIVRAKSEEDALKVISHACTARYISVVRVATSLKIA
jgi:hypothetical protein